MKAEVRLLTVEQSADFDVANGQEVEVIGFVHHGAMLWAVWRDDYGDVRELPAWCIRMVPNTGTAAPDSITVSARDFHALSSVAVGIVDIVR